MSANLGSPLPNSPHILTNPLDMKCTMISFISAPNYPDRDVEKVLRLSSLIFQSGSQLLLSTTCQCDVVATFLLSSSHSPSHAVTLLLSYQGTYSLFNRISHFHIPWDRGFLSSKILKQNYLALSQGKQ